MSQKKTQQLFSFPKQATRFVFVSTKILYGNRQLALFIRSKKHVKKNDKLHYSCFIGALLFLVWFP